MGYKVRIFAEIKYWPKAGLKRYMLDGYKLRAKYPKGHPLNTITKVSNNSLSYGKFAMKFNAPKMKLFFNVEKKATIDKFIYNHDITKKLVVENGNVKTLVLFYLEKKVPLGNTVSRAYRDISEGRAPETTQAYSIRTFKMAQNCLHLSAVVTAQARITMYYFLQEQYAKNNLVYTDTDSIIFNADGASAPHIKKRKDPSKFGFFKVKA